MQCCPRTKWQGTKKRKKQKTWHNKTNTHTRELNTRTATTTTTTSSCHFAVKWLPSTQQQQQRRVDPKLQPSSSHGSFHFHALINQCYVSFTLFLSLSIVTVLSCLVWSLSISLFLSYPSVFVLIALVGLFIFSL